MQRAFEYKLYPTQEQESLFEETLETLRHLYNNALGERIDAYKREQHNVGYLERKRQLPTLKQRAAPLKKVYSQVAQDCIVRLQRAYENFFRRVTLGLEEPGFPRFKGIGRYRSFTYPQFKGGFDVFGSVLRLSKIGDITIRLHRPLQGTPKTCTVSRKADGATQRMKDEG